MRVDHSGGNQTFFIYFEKISAKCQQNIDSDGILRTLSFREKATLVRFCVSAQSEL